MPIINPAPTPNGAPSVIKEPLQGEYNFGDVVLYYASVADDIPLWGTSPAARDMKLREFWPTEPMLASALFSTVARYAAFGWQLDGPDRTVGQYDRMLHNVEMGAGWEQMTIKFLIDYFTQDNGAFLEVVRFDDSPDSPVATLNHLDSARCVRTGRTDVPVIYWDRWGKPHDMKWYQIIAMAEFPSPIESMRGMGYCAVTRMLRAAQIMRDIGVHEREKISGRFSKVIWLVSGVNTKTITDAMTKHQSEADGQGLTRYIQPLVLASLDPTAKVSAEKLELASLPDGWDAEKNFRLYITQLALAFGTDYQDFAPLSTGNMGNSQQSETLHLKARGKGPRLFMTQMEHRFNFHGVLPNNIKFTFGDQDVAEDMDHQKLRTMRAEERAMRIKSGELTPQVARQLALQYGDITEELVEELEKQDAEQEALMQEQMRMEASADPSGDVQVGKPRTTQNRNTAGSLQGAPDGN